MKSLFPTHTLFYAFAVWGCAWGQIGITQGQNLCQSNLCNGPNTVWNGNFEEGPPDMANFSLDFDTEFTYATCPPNNPAALWGRISIQQDPNVCYQNWNSTDHTYQNGTGHMLLVDFPAQNPNGTNNFMDIWKKEVNVTPGATYCFSAYFKNLHINLGLSEPNFRFIVDGTLIGTSPDLPENGNWELFGHSYTVPLGTNTVIISIQNGKFGGDGNDLAIDDISFREVRTGGNPPLPADDFAVVQPNAVNFPINILANDSANNVGFTPGAANISLTSLPDSTEGSVIIASNGELQFTPNPNFIGTCTFAYELCHPSGCCSPALVSISVDVILPVKLTAFAAQTAGQQVNLSWQTPQNWSSAAFEVERSPNGANFARVATVLSRGGTQEVSRSYHFTDTEVESLPGQVWHYRLAWRTPDGQVQYSQILRVLRAHADHFQCLVFPNPSQAGRLSIGCPQAQSPLHLQLIDLQGRAVMNTYLEGQPGQEHELRVDQLPAGIYLLRLSDAVQSFQQRVLLP